MWGVLAAEIHWVVSAAGLLTIPALVALNGLFVAAEFSLVAVRRTRVEELVQRGVSGAAAVQTAIARLDRTIAATQLGITLASIALGWVGEPALAWLIEPLFRFVPETWSGVAVHTAATGTAFLLITFMHVVFGELIPKTLALQTPDQTALWIARPLNVFAWLTRPLILAMNGTGNAIIRWCGYHPAEGTALVHSVDELALLIEDTEEAGILDADQAELVQNVFRLSGKRVRDCMVPREKMATLELHSPPDQVLEVARRGAHTRIPVYDTELDNIVGIVNTKDLFYLFSLRGVVVLEDAMYPASFLKPDESVGTALRLFKATRRPMALVRDDTGRILGLITLEDVLEEIVGDIEDEHDRPTPRLPRRWRPVAGRTRSRPGGVSPSGKNNRPS
ncbi:MAG: hemolysin family protein [Gemmataceae bacterium]|nr:hemolysin family protein [Gemmataceae bacterium]MDW8264895.1 hemolysin family protein [Gemmataceae bacterium]